MLNNAIFTLLKYPALLCEETKEQSCFFEILYLHVVFFLSFFFLISVIIFVWLTHLFLLQMMMVTEKSTKIVPNHLQVCEN
jgi:F0F1-type ATP synthase membrane subunit a